MALSGIAYTPVFGLPLILYLGVITLSIVVITAVMGAMVLRGRAKIKWHMAAAAIAIIMAIVHGALGLLAYL